MCEILAYSYRGISIVTMPMSLLRHAKMKTVDRSLSYWMPLFSGHIPI